jgi:hypothetical protein
VLKKQIFMTLASGGSVNHPNHQAILYHESAVQGGENFGAGLRLPEHGPGGRHQGSGNDELDEFLN